MPDKWPVCGKSCLRCWRNKLTHACPTSQRKNEVDTHVYFREDDGTVPEPIILGYWEKRKVTASNYKKLAKEWDISEAEILNQCFPNGLPHVNYGTYTPLRRGVGKKSQKTLAKRILREEKPKTINFFAS